jgi:hypothetical protein
MRGGKFGNAGKKVVAGGGEIAKKLPGRKF